MQITNQIIKRAGIGIKFRTLKSARHCCLCQGSLKAAHTTDETVLK